MISLRLSAPNPASGFFHLKWEITNVEQEVLRFRLPTWRPGRYRLQDYVRNLRHLIVADSGGKAIAYIQTAKSEWQVEIGSQTSCVVEYEYFARELDAGGCWLDDQLWYLNFINCALQFIGFEDEPIKFSEGSPSSYTAYSPLKRNDSGWEAEGFYELVDSSYLASETIREVPFNVSGVDFRFIIYGDFPVTDAQLIKEHSLYAKEQIALFGSFPEKKFDFILMCFPFKHYHGVEHEKSTVITIGPSSKLCERALYKELLGVCSHELFHAWNVKKIVPEEFVPYDFDKPAHFSTGFVVEGATTYYGDYMLARSGVFSLEEYLQELSKLINRHQHNTARLSQSLVEASYGLWADGYGSKTPGRGTSIYVEGALAFLLLDLRLRKSTDHQVSTDRLMQELWQKFGVTGKGYSYQDIKNIVNQLTEIDYTGWFERYIEEQPAFIEELEQLLDWVGLQITTTPPDNKLAHKLGIQLTRNKVAVIWPGSPLEKQLMLGDEIIAINQQKLQGDASDESSFLRLGTNTLTVSSMGRLREIILRPNGDSFFLQYTVELLDNLEDVQQQNLKKWLALGKVKNKPQ